MTLPTPNSQIDLAAGFVRKPLDPDCLLDGQLHPSVADRLARVRDLPVMAMANLRGVERGANGNVWLIWEFIDGQTLEDYLKTERSDGELEHLRRTMNGIVEQIHSHGLVHGAIHARNFMIDRSGEVRITHMSPLLYTDPAEDIECLAEVFALFPHTASSEDTESAKPRRRDRRIRMASYAMALGSIAVGIVIFWLILWYIHP